MTDFKIRVNFMILISEFYFVKILSVSSWFYVNSNFIFVGNIYKIL